MDDALREEKRRCNRLRRGLLLGAFPALLLVVAAVLQELEVLPPAWLDAAFLRCMVLGGGLLNKEAVEKGFRGTIDGMKVITVPSSLWPSLTGGSATLNFIIKYKGATVDPMKLKNLRVQKNPMGIDGDVVEGRYIYDSFVKDASCDGIFISTT